MQQGAGGAFKQQSALAKPGAGGQAFAKWADYMDKGVMYNKWRWS